MDNYDWWDKVIEFHVVPGQTPHFIGSASLPVRLRVKRQGTMLTTGRERRGAQAPPEAMHIGLEATNLRTQELGGIWRYTESLIRGIARLAAPHEYSLLFLNALKRGARVPVPRMTAPNMRLVEVTSVSNFLFTLFVPMLPRGWGRPTVESYLGPVDVFHSVNAMVLPQR